MKKLARYTFSLILALFATAAVQAQIYEPVEWDWGMEYTEDGNVKLLFTPSIEDHWHIYSLNVEGGPLPTEFEFAENPKVEWVTDLMESEPIFEYDKSFEVDLAYHEDGAYFYRIIKVKEATTVKGTLSFMVCNDEMCLPPEWIDFEIEVKPKAGAATTSGAGSQNKPQIEEKPQDNTPVDEVIEEDTAVAVAESDVTDVEAMPETEEAEMAEEGSGDQPKSLWGIFLFAVGGGLIALVTPCVFPMVPMTVSFFTKQSKTPGQGISKALLYGFSIVAIYVLISLPFHLFSQISPDIFNQFSTNSVLNVILFAIFIFFALSFLGAYEITLPSSWINSADKKADKGGVVGIFFMAIVLILVSFTCTGPALAGVLGSVLSTDGGATALTVAFLGFGLGLAFPFTLFAIFPGWMNSLPKSGGWMNVVKVSLGFIELAFAFKFLSQADLVEQWHILEREVFLAIWVAVFAAWAMYMFNLFRLPHDSDVNKISVGRGVMGVLVLSFTFYMIPGLFGAPLKLIAGMPPPSFYSETPGGLYQARVVSSGGGEAHAADHIEGTHPESCPHGLNCFHDYETGLAYAKEVNKPILLDFTGWACVNCRRMEENVWSDPTVLNHLRNDYVLISLYVDERKELPENEQYTSEVTGKKVRNVGNYWTDFQITNYQNNGQPFYVIVGHDNLEPLVAPRAYDTDIQAYISWLETGMKKFEEGK